MVSVYLAHRQGLDDRHDCGRSAQTSRHPAQERPHLPRDLDGDRLVGLAPQARHAVFAVIGNPDVDEPLRYAKEFGRLNGRPTVDENTLDDLGSVYSGRTAAD